MIERTFDDDSGIIRVVSSGLWTRSEIDDHYAALRNLMAEVRLQMRPVRVLSDVRGASRQSPWNENHILAQMEQTYGPWDRVAILAANIEDKTHIRTLLSGTEIWCFCSELAAEQFLLLDDLGSHAA